MFYQLAWVRQLTGATTAATIAMVLVLAAFMAGLGVGAWAGGLLARRATNAFRAYAIVEIAAAVLFVGGMFVVSGSVRLHAALVDAGMSGRGALIVQLAAVAVYLAIATTLLGMTLPLLVAGIERDETTRELVTRGAAYNLIYGVNTFGAVAGALICGYVTIEMVGLTRSILLGAMFSLASGAIALALGRRESPLATDGDEARVASPISRRLLAVVALTGMVAIGSEVLWVRMLSLVMLNTVYAFTQVLAAVLIGIALAGVLAAVIARRFLRRDAAAGISRVTFGALVVASVTTSAIPWLVRELGGLDGFAGLAASGRSPLVMASLALVLVPTSCVLAAALPLVVAASAGRDATAAVARLFAANTAGAVVGALLVGLVLLPLFGSGPTQLVLVGGILVAAGLVAASRRAWMVIAITAVACGWLSRTVTLPDDLYALRFERSEHVLELREGITSDVLVTEDPTGHRRIWINSAWVAGTGGGHALLGHLPALSVARPRKALGIALGTGQTFDALLQHGVEQLDCVEINPDVVALSRRWFSTANHDLFGRSGVHVHIEDGRAFLRATREKYDVIVLEPLQAWSAGTTALYTREFYADARRALADGGVLAQWIPFYGQDTEATRAMVRTALEVFPEASLWLDESDGILIAHADRFSIQWPAIAAASREGVLAKLLAAKHLDASTDLLSLFLMGPRGLRAWTDGADVITDDRPFLEYAAARDLGHASFVPTLRSTLPFLDDPATYVADAGDAALARQAALVRETCVPAELEQCTAEIEQTLASSSGNLHYQYRQIILTLAESVRASPAQREAVLARGVDHDADFGEAMVNLAISLARRGQRDAAINLATRAAAIPRTRANAQRVLAKLGAAP